MSSFSSLSRHLKLVGNDNKNMLGSRFRVVVWGKIWEITVNRFDGEIFETTLTNIFSFHFTSAIVEVVIFLKIINNSSS